MPTLKILIVGDVNGQFRLLYKKVRQIMKKHGQFDMLLCVGTFFKSKDPDWENYISDGDKVPIETYILGPNSEAEKKFYPIDLKSATINEKIRYLGSSGKYSTVKNLRIGFVSGLEGDSNSPDDWMHSLSTVQNLSYPSMVEDPEVDIFMSSAWPHGIEKLSNETINITNPSKTVAKCAAALKPWYHIVGYENKFFEPPPYGNRMRDGSLISLTRFIALAPVGSEGTWIKAIQYDVPRTWRPIDAETEFVPSPYTDITFSEEPFYSRFDTTYFPSLSGAYVTSGQSNNASLPSTSGPSNNASLPSSSASANEASLPSTSAPSNGLSTFSGSGRTGRSFRSPRKDCWFCLGPKKDNHLVIKVKKYSYIAVCHGGLVDTHLNIVPIAHKNSYYRLGERWYKELLQIKDFIRRFFSKKGQRVLFYERNYKCHHTHVCCIPLSMNVAKVAFPAFLHKVNCLRLTVEIIDESLTGVKLLAPGRPYCHIGFPSGEDMIINIDEKFPFNFVRQVLCDVNLLNTPSRADWQACVLDKEEETLIASQLRKAMSFTGRY